MSDTRTRCPKKPLTGWVSEAKAKANLEDDDSIGYRITIFITLEGELRTRTVEMSADEASAFLAAHPLGSRIVLQDVVELYDPEVST